MMKKREYVSPKIDITVFNRTALIGTFTESDPELPMDPFSLRDWVNGEEK